MEKVKVWAFFFFFLTVKRKREISTVVSVDDVHISGFGYIGETINTYQHIGVENNSTDPSFNHL